MIPGVGIGKLLKPLQLAGFYGRFFSKPVICAGMAVNALNAGYGGL
jgi:hypothetical protein